MASEDASLGSIQSTETAGTYSQNSVDPIEENPDAANLDRNEANQTDSDDSPPSTQTTEENRAAANPDQNEANQTDSDDPASILITASALMENGLRTFQDSKFTKSVRLFKLVLKTLTGSNVEFADQMVPTNFKYDLMTEALPMEADYQLYGSTIVAKQVPHDDGLESAGLQLFDILKKVALKLVETQPGDLVEKVDVLSVLGEVALKKGSYMDSCKHYQEALSILERVVELDNQRIAHLNFKICFCLANCNKIEETIEYCQKAILVCKNRIQRLKSSSGLANVNQEPSSSVPDVGPSLPKKDDDALLELLLREFEKKLLILQQWLKSSSSTSSINAREMVEKQPGDSVKKVEHLSSLGDKALEKGNYVDSQKHYHDALSILKLLVEPSNERMAYLKFKICLCSAHCYNIKKANEYCEKTISVCQNWLQRLKSSSGLANVNQEPTSSVPDVEVVILEQLIRKIENELPILQQPLKSSSPTTSRRQLSASKEPMSATRKQPEHSPPTAGKGAKGQFFPDPSSNESTPTKKQSLDQSADEDN